MKVYFEGNEHKFRSLLLNKKTADLRGWLSGSLDKFYHHWWRTGLKLVQKLLRLELGQRLRRLKLLIQ